MNIYLAGTTVADPSEVENIKKLFKRGHKLHSYYHIPVLEKKWWKVMKENKVDLFLDSGAFSAWIQKKPIDIQDYISFVKENESYITVYANLDVIGVGGAQPNEKTAELTLKNQKIMEEAGLHPLPAFHFGEPFSYLKYYVENYDYLALGIAGNHVKVLQAWMDECFFNYICDSKGMPKTRVHGFAVTAFDLMFRYPFYSVDSTSWVMTGRFGSVLVPRFKSGKYIYTEPPWKIAVSNQSPDIREAGQHFTSFAPMEQEMIVNYLNSKKIKLGKSEYKKVKDKKYKLQQGERWAGQIEMNIQKAEGLPVDYNDLLVEKVIESGVCNDYRLRDEVNIIYYLDLEKHFPAWPWPFKLHEKKQMKGFGLK